MIKKLLIGFHNPDVNYPAFVNPLVKHDERDQVYIYLKDDPRSKDGLIKLPDSAKSSCTFFDSTFMCSLHIIKVHDWFSKTEFKWYGRSKILLPNTSIFAVSKQEIWLYLTENEKQFLQQLLIKPEFSQSDPVRRFSFAQIAYENQKEVLLSELENARQHPKFEELRLSDWYQEEYDKLH